jgi:hypothetical protein
MVTLIVTLLLCEAIVLGSLVYTDHGIWGAFSLVVALAIYSLIAGIETVSGGITYVVQHPLQVGLGALLYLVVGTIWSFFKYYSFIRQGKRDGVSKAVLAASNNTSLVITWMAYWPISAVLHVVGDGVRRLFIWIYDQVSGVYDSILNKVYGK